MWQQATANFKPYLHRSYFKKVFTSNKVFHVEFLCCSKRLKRIYRYSIYIREYSFKIKRKNSFLAYSKMFSNIAPRRIKCTGFAHFCLVFVCHQKSINLLRKLRKLRRILFHRKPIKKGI